MDYNQQAPSGPPSTHHYNNQHCHQSGVKSKTTFHEGSGDSCSVLKGSSPTVQQTTMRGKAHNNGTEANGHTNNHNHHNNNNNHLSRHGHGQSGSPEDVTTTNGHSHHQRDHRDALENVKPNLHSHSGTTMPSMQNGNNMQSNNSSQRYFNGHPQQQQNRHYQNENGTKKDNHHPFSHSNDNNSNQKNGLKHPKDIGCNGKVDQNGCNSGQQMRRVRNRSESSESAEVQQFVNCNGSSGRNVKVADQKPCANGVNGGSTHQQLQQLLGSSVEDVS